MKDWFFEHQKKEAEAVVQQAGAIETIGLPDFDCEIVMGNPARLVIEDFALLGNAKRYLNKVFELSKWEIRQRFFTQGKTITTWRTEQAKFEIWFECAVEDYPDELKSDHCNWKKKANSTVKVEDYAFVCDNKGGE